MKAFLSHHRAFALNYVDTIVDATITDKFKDKMFTVYSLHAAVPCDTHVHCNGFLNLLVKREQMLPIL